MKVKSWAELERFAGIERTVPPAFTQRDAQNLRRKRLGRSPFWKKKR